MKSSLLDLPSCQAAVKSTSRWILLLILFPVGLLLAFWLLRDELVAFLIRLFPHEPDKTVGFYRDLLTLWMSEILWLSSFLLLALALFRHRRGLDHVIQRLSPTTVTRTRMAAAGIIAVSFVATIIVTYYALDCFPNSSDEYVYLYQARAYSEGRLWESSHPLPDFFTFNHIASKDGVNAGRFPPGWPLFLSAAYYFGFPSYIVNPVLGLISLVVFFSFARRFYNERVALWATASLALTAYYIFNSASFFSHTSCLLMTVAFVYAINLHFESKRITSAVLAGLFLGIIIAIRYYTAVLIFVPFFAYTVYHYRRKSIPTLFWIGAGALPPMLLLLWYNYAITGNPLVPVTMWAYENEALGFVRGHTWLKGFEHVIRRAFMFLYWCSPALLILYVVFLWRKIRTRGERMRHPQDYTFLMLVVGYFFYYEIGGNQYGPRFFLEALPFLILFVVHKVLEHQRRWMLALLFAGMAVAIVKTPFIAQREHGIIEERQDIYRLTEAHGLQHAVVLIASPVGVTRPMPIGDLIRNDGVSGNDVLYARDIPGRNQELFAFYPDREFYVYTREMSKTGGQLIRLCP